MSDGWGSSPRGLSMWRSEWGNMRALQEQIDSQMASAASTQHRLSSQLSRLQGDLTQRVDRLSRAFDAFVELSQLRDELGLHADARRWRIAARRLVESKISLGPTPAGGGTESLADVPGYWLAAAARALPSAIEGGGPADDLDEAARRDELRTATFVATVAPLLGAPELGAAWVERAFEAHGDSSITSAQRAIWLATTDGLLPPASRTTVRDALSARLAALDGPTRDGLVADLAARPPGSGSAVRPAPGAGAPSAQATAVSALGQWSAFLDTVSGPAGAEPGVAVPVAAAPADTTSLPPPHVVSGPATAAPVAGAPVDVTSLPTDDLLLEVVRSLVEEGSVEERPLLDRAEQLAAFVDPSQPQRTTEWDAADRSIADLLGADLRDDAHPQRRQLAVLLLRDAIGAAADRLVEQAATEPATTTAVRIGGRSVPITAEGADPAELAAATAPLPRRRRLGPVQLGAGVVVVLGFVVLAAAVAAGWAVVAVLGAVGLGAWWLVERNQVRHAAEEDEPVASRARQQVSERAQALVTAHEQAHGAAREAVRVRDQVRVKLAALSG